MSHVSFALILGRSKLNIMNIFFIWNLSGVASNATCYMAFRLAKIGKRRFLRVWGVLNILVFFAVIFNMVDIDAPIILIIILFW